MWARKDDGAILRLHDRSAGSDPASRGECVLDVGGRWGPGRSDRWRRCQAEDAGEDLRLFYVAATRAQCQLVTWWAPSYNTPASALQRLLYRPIGDDGGPGPGAGVRGAGRPVRRPRPRVAGGASRRWPSGSRRTGIRRAPTPARWPRAASTGCWTPSGGGPPTPGSPRPPTGASRPSPAWPASPSRPRRTTRSPAPAESDGLLAAPSPDADLVAALTDGRSARSAPSSASRCTRCSRRSTRRRATWTPSCAALARRYWPGCRRATFTADQLAAGLAPAFATPLGPLAGDRTLADIPRRDRLAELGFELPLAGGEVTRAELLLADLVAAAPRAPAARRPPRGVPRRAGRPGAGRPDAPRLPHRQHRRRAPGAGSRRRAALPGRRLQDQLARARWTARR